MHFEQVKDSIASWRSEVATLTAAEILRRAREPEAIAKPKRPIFPRSKSEWPTHMTSWQQHTISYGNVMLGAVTSSSQPNLKTRPSNTTT
jgi:hypothetical protein